MIHIGEQVKITDTGKIYSSYPEFLDYFRQVGCATMVERVCAQYEYGRSPTASEARDGVFKVMFVREHGQIEGRYLAIINDYNVTYVIDVEGLSVVSSDLPFIEGDKVYISDTMRCYSSWDSLIHGVSSVIPDGEEVCHKWCDGASPSDRLIGGKFPGSIFTVKWIGHHPTRPDEDTLAIISNDSHTYMMSVKGLTKTGEKSWDKYIIYVRNWAVMNRENAQSVRDATGPKSYAEWLNNKS